MSASATPPDSAAQVHPGLSNAQLGHILARALEEVDQLKAERDAAVTRATRAESLTSNSPSVNVDPVQANSETIASLQALNEQQQRTISELTGRLKAVTDAYTAFERAYGSYDAKVHDARQNLARAIRPQHNASSAHSSPQLPHSDTSSGFQPIPSRKSSRTATLPPPPSPASQYHQHHSHHQHQHQQGAHLHPSLQIPPGAPGGRSTVSAGVPANLPPVPIAGRVRLREDSIPRRQSDESPAPRHRLSADDAADLAAVDDGERRAKRFRSEAHAAPPRRDRARFTESVSFPAHSLPCPVVRSRLHRSTERGPFLARRKDAPMCTSLLLSLTATRRPTHFLPLPRSCSLVLQLLVSHRNSPSHRLDQLARAMPTP